MKNVKALASFIILLVAPLLTTACTRDRASTCATDLECAPGLCDLLTNTCAMPPGFDAGPDATDADGMGTDALVDGLGGDAMGGCVESANCSGARPVCADAICVACALDEQCAAKASTPFCDVPSGACVACKTHSDCPETTPTCLSGVCGLCNAQEAPAQACAARGAGKPACSAVTGLCVECTSSNECAVSSKPICASNACRACDADAECVAKLGAEPGVCMKHDDGRCAGLADAVFAENVAGKCMNTPQAGTVATPFCAFQSAVDAAKSGNKAVVVLKGPAAVDRASYNGSGKLAVIGKAEALISGGAGPGFHVSGGEVYLRGITVEASRPGLQVTNGAKLSVEQATVINNPGGGVLADGGTLVVFNSLVSGNGPGFLGATAWGGVLLNAAGAGTRLERVSVLDNKNTGVACSAGDDAQGVRASGNVGIEIAPACNFVSCGAAGPMCGAGL